MAQIDTNAREQWDREGYIAKRSAIPRELITAFENDLRNLWDDPDTTCKVHVEHDGVVTLPEATRLDLSHHHYRILDIHTYLPSAAAIGNHPSILSAFGEIFGREPTLCQSLTFEYGSEQPLHQDWCFVTTCAPDVPDMVGVWVALDTVEEDNGPLVYYPRSHTMPRYPYTAATHDGFKPYLDTHVNGLESKKFLAEPGDVLLWHGDLAHAGSPVQNKEKRRLSMILHYSFMNSRKKNEKQLFLRTMNNLKAALHI